MIDLAIQQVVACKGIIVRKGKILLMRESAGHVTNSKAGLYQFPGGRIEPGEPFEKGLKREILEETGLEVTTGAPFYVGEWFPVVKDQPLHIVGIFFLCEDKGGEVAISEEHDEYRWVDEADLSGINIMTPDLYVAQQYLSRPQIS